MLTYNAIEISTRQNRAGTVMTTGLITVRKEMLIQEASGPQSAVFGLKYVTFLWPPYKKPYQNPKNMIKGRTEFSYITIGFVTRRHFMIMISGDHDF